MAEMTIIITINRVVSFANFCNRFVKELLKKNLVTQGLNLVYVEIDGFLLPYLNCKVNKKLEENQQIQLTLLIHTP